MMAGFTEKRRAILVAAFVAVLVGVGVFAVWGHAGNRSGDTVGYEAGHMVKGSDFADNGQYLAALREASAEHVYAEVDTHVEHFGGEAAVESSVAVVTFDRGDYDAVRSAIEATGLTWLEDDMMFEGDRCRAKVHGEGDTSQVRRTASDAVSGIGASADFNRMSKPLETDAERYYRRQMCTDASSDDNSSRMFADYNGDLASDMEAYIQSGGLSAAEKREAEAALAKIRDAASRWNATADEEDASIAEALARRDADPRWPLDLAGFSSVWGTVKSNHHVTIAVIDVAFDKSHEDLAGNVVLAWNSVKNRQLTDTYHEELDTSHGTEVAGIAAAVAGNDVGIDGASWNANLMLFETGVYDEDEEDVVLDDYAIDTSYRMIADMPNPPDVLNMSYGESFYESEDIWGEQYGSRAEYEAYKAQRMESEQELMNRLVARNVVCVASAGNDYDDTSSIPAVLDGVIVVAAHDSEKVYHMYSSFGDHVDIAAPSDPVLAPTVVGQGLTELDFESFVSGFLIGYLRYDEVPLEGTDMTVSRYELTSPYYDGKWTLYCDDSVVSTTVAWRDGDDTTSMFGWFLDDSGKKIQGSDFYRDDSPAYDPVLDRGGLFYKYDFSGTSCATPFVSAAAALVRAYYPDLPAMDVEDVLKGLCAADDLSRSSIEKEMAQAQASGGSAVEIGDDEVPIEALRKMARATDEQLWGAGRLEMRASAFSKAIGDGYVLPLETIAGKIDKDRANGASGWNERWAEPEGDAKFKDGVFEVSYYIDGSTRPTWDDAVARSVFRLDEDGTISADAMTTGMGSLNGAVVWPYRYGDIDVAPIGVICVREVLPPEGYLVNPMTYVVRVNAEDGDAPTCEYLGCFIQPGAPSYNG